MDDRKIFLENLSGAMDGDGICMYNVGICYQYGKGVNADIDKAIEWFEKSAKYGYGTAIVLVGGIFGGCQGFDLQSGIDHSRFYNLPKYIKYIEMGYDIGIPISVYYMGHIHRQGLGNYDINMKLAANCWLDVISGVDYEEAYNTEKEDDTVFGLYGKLSTTYAVISSYRDLGTAFFRGGYGLPKILDNAIYYWGKAANLGSVIAADKLISLYSDGEELPIDEAKVDYWWNIRSEKGKYYGLM